mmetsp:Transcript_56912/g.133726  ORF Transcript_56912/g.133726 Transcript_56912/m.133726 type:complete len:139 (+) Transcript_56912:68-484(+)
MKMILAALTLVVASNTALAVLYPVYSPGASDTLETCSGISCTPIDCKPPFKYKSPEETGTCCPLCWADDVKTPEDRSWTKDLSGSAGMDNNADPILCRDVVCPPLVCPEYDQMFDGRCCTKCKSSAEATQADFAASYS